MTTLSPTRIASAGFRAIGTRHRILVTEPDVLVPAVDLAREQLAALDLAASRFRPDSEVSRLAEGCRDHDAWGHVSRLLMDHLEAALRMAHLPDGLVDPTVGAAVVAAGYDDDLDVVRARRAPVVRRRAEVAGWRSVVLEPASGRVLTRAGTLLDLGATAKAHAADRLAEALAATLPGGFLVNLGGDVATGGEQPDAGWQVGVEAADGSVLQVVTGRAFATSSTRLRTWATTDGPAHHVLDPRTGRPARTPWAQVTCAAATALEANAASTAALVLGEDAPAWLREHGVPARLDDLDGRVATTPGWPDPSGPEAQEA